MMRLQTRGRRPLRGAAGRLYVRYGKRALDLVLGLPLFLLSLPLLAGLVVAVAIDVGRPVFIRQPRVGAAGRVFGMLKFRTMHPCRRRRHGGPPRGVERRRTHKHPEDPRLTRLGRRLRRWSLDELPQLWHVVTGTMSLVGPRPELVEIVETYEPWQHARHRVKPGLTGLWQVTERRPGAVMHHCVLTDLAYLEQLSFTTDLRILARTVPVLVGGSGH